MDIKDLNALVPFLRSALGMALAMTTLGQPAAAQSASAAVNVGSRPKAVGATAERASTRIALDTVSTLVGRTGETSPANEPGRNPYVGAQLGYSLNGTGDLASNLVAAGSVMYTVIGADAEDTSPVKFFLPIRGNLSNLTAADTAARSKDVQHLLSSVTGLRVGVEPYLTLKGPNSYIHPVIFGSAGWKINNLKDKTDTSHVVTVGRLSLGGEVGFGPSDGSKLPVTIDIAGVYSAFADRSYRAVFGDDFPKALWSGELTMVMPVFSNAAVLSEAIMGQHAVPVWRIGLIMVAQGGK